MRRADRERLPEKSAALAPRRRGAAAGLGAAVRAHRRRIQWRAKAGLPPAGRFVSSPYDEGVHLVRRRSMHRIGYTAHRTEARDEARPSLIVSVSRPPPAVADGNMPRHPRRALGGALAAPRACHRHRRSQRRVTDDEQAGVRGGLGRRRPSKRPLAGAGAHRPRPEGLSHRPGPSAGDCSEGHAGKSRTSAVGQRTSRVIAITSLERDCRRCPRSQKRYPRRIGTIREWKAFAARRLRGDTRGVRRRLRRTRYPRQERAHLGHALTAVGRNVVRLGAWFVGTPFAYPPAEPPSARDYGGIAVTCASPY